MGSGTSPGHDAGRSVSLAPLSARTAEQAKATFAPTLDEPLDQILALATATLHTLAQLAIHPALIPGRDARPAVSGRIGLLRHSADDKAPRPADHHGISRHPFSTSSRTAHIEVGERLGDLGGPSRKHEHGQRQSTSRPGDTLPSSVRRTGP